MSTNKNINFLFSNFLEDKRVYALNQRYWKKNINTILVNNSIEGKHWVKSDTDGNPIFSSLIATNKAVRIIQEEPETDFYELGAWVKKTEDIKGNLVHELVISLELSKTTKIIALDLIKNWIKKDIQLKDMEILISSKLDTLNS